MNRVVFLERLRSLAQLTEFGIKSRVLRSGKRIVIETPNKPGQFVSHYPKSIEIMDPKSDSHVLITKKSAREADVDIAQTPTDAHGTGENIGTIKSFLPIFRNFKKNKIAVEYDPVAMSRSRQAGAVTTNGALNQGYIAIARKLGFTHRVQGGVNRLEP
jgi:hypothetical protein